MDNRVHHEQDITSNYEDYQDEYNSGRYGWLFFITLNFLRMKMKDNMECRHGKGKYCYITFGAYES